MKKKYYVHTINGLVAGYKFPYIYYAGKRITTKETATSLYQLRRNIEQARIHRMEVGVESNDVYGYFILIVD